MAGADRTTIEEVVKRRSEQALLAVVQQAYVCGVSTRRVYTVASRSSPQFWRQDDRR